MGSNWTKSGKEGCEACANQVELHVSHINAKMCIYVLQMLVDKLMPKVNRRVKIDSATVSPKNRLKEHTSSRKLAKLQKVILNKRHVTLNSEVLVDTGSNL